MAAVRPLERASEVEPLAGRACEDRARELFERYERRVTSFCRWQLGSREEAEDAAQTTFLQAFAAIRRGVVPVAEVPWLLAIARNVCLTRLDSTRRRAKVEVARDPHVLADAVAGPEGGVDDLFGLHEALGVLPEQQRRAILLREWKGLSYREIADDLGLSLAAVETLIFRARRGLAGQLAHGFEPTRKRLAGLLDLGALLSGVKSIVGGAGAVKAAAGVVAVTGVMVAGSSLVEPPSSAGKGRDESRWSATATPMVVPASAAGSDVMDVPRRPSPAAEARPGDARPPRTGPRGAGAPTPADPGAGHAGPTASGPDAPAGGPPAGGAPGIPDGTAPPASLPDIELPEVTIPGVGVPDVEVPGVDLPDLAVPGVELPDVELPQLPIVSP